MKFLILLICLLAIFLFGINCTKTNSAASLPKADAAKTIINSAPSPVSEIAETSSNISFDKLAEETELPEFPKYSVRMMMNSQFYEEEVEDKPGLHKGWLGLYKNKNKYTLIPTTIRVKVVSHNLRDYKKSTEKTGREISSNVKLPNVFLLKNAKTLKPGEVKTVFYGNEDSSDSINRTYRREFDFNGAKYALFVEDSSKEGGDYLTKDSKMMLSAGNRKQIIYKPEGCNDCSWDLCWVGDLDKDGKLDFMLNLTSHYNSTCHTLFLSSQAKEGEIVRDVAELCQQGC